MHGCHTITTWLVSYTNLHQVHTMKHYISLYKFDIVKIMFKINGGFLSYCIFPGYSRDL